MRHVKTTTVAAVEGGGETTATVAYFDYPHEDHLGSVEGIADGDAARARTLAYDPFGARRKADWTAALTEAEVSALAGSSSPRTRGHTGHEHLDRTGLINRGGRVYDPVLGRFLSPDPLVSDPGSAQSWNPYSYVSNSPMSYVDPSGLSQAPAGGVSCVPVGFSCRGAAGGGYGVETVASTYDYDYFDVFVSVRVVFGGFVGGGNGPGLLDGWWDYMDPFVEVTHHAVGRSGTVAVAGEVPVVGVPNVTGKDISVDTVEGQSSADREFNTCVCVGNARILLGNANHIGKDGGFGEEAVIDEGSVAIDPAQFGGKGKVRPHLKDISGYVDGEAIFDNVADVVGGDSPISDMNVREALKLLNPNTLILELPGGEEDMGVVPIELRVPCALSCPSGTE